MRLPAIATTSTTYALAASVLTVIAPTTHPATAYALTGTALTGTAPAGIAMAAAAPAWVTDSECTDDGGEIVPVGQGKAICRGGVWDHEQIHFD